MSFPFKQAISSCIYLTESLRCCVSKLSCLNFVVKVFYSNEIDIFLILFSNLMICCLEWADYSSNCIINCSPLLTFAANLDIYSSNSSFSCKNSSMLFFFSSLHALSFNFDSSKAYLLKDSSSSSSLHFCICYFI